MGKRGQKPKGKVALEWSPDFAYAIGLLVSDGNLSPSGRHIAFTSKDEELALLFQKALKITVRMGKKNSGSQNEKKYFVVQFSDVNFYAFLMSIGITPKKSKTIGTIFVPDRYFFHFLRGSFDGDGCTYSYWDRRWKSSFMFYTVFASASKDHVNWLQSEIQGRLGIKGHITLTGRGKSEYQLRYAKSDSLVLLRHLYPKTPHLSLTRKKLKIKRMLRIVGEHL